MDRRTARHLLVVLLSVFLAPGSRGVSPVRGARRVLVVEGAVQADGAGGQDVPGRVVHMARVVLFPAVFQVPLVLMLSDSR